MTAFRCFALAAVFTCQLALAIERPGKVFKIFQFPANMIPRIDGSADDWTMVPDDYAFGMELCNDDRHPGSKPDPKNLGVKVKIGWVKGLNRLYFLYEAYDNYWDFSRPDLHNDTFEVIVDGDLSGGPLIDEYHPNKDILSPMEQHFSFHGVHAQNYHIFVPAEGKDWTLVWGCPQYIKELPYANHAYEYNFKPGEPGKLTLEFWITPFDYAGCEGPERSVETPLWENRAIGLGMVFLDYDDVNSEDHTFWNPSPKHTLFGQASELLAFRLMPLEPQFRKKIEAQWSFKVVDMNRRLIAFQDLSEGKIASWKWDFGDGTTSTEQHPIHAYKEPGERYLVTLWVEGPEGKSRRAKVWDVVIR
jgi:hypothetical protein